MKGLRRSLNKDKSSPSSSYSDARPSHAYAQATRILPSAPFNASVPHHVASSASPIISGTVTSNISMPGAPGRTGQAAPALVISAIESWKPVSPTQLGFKAGDFFFVYDADAGVGGPGGEDWFMASNPATGARGLVPRRCFKIMGKNEKGASASRTTSPSLKSTSPAFPSPQSTFPPSQPQHANIPQNPTNFAHGNGNGAPNGNPNAPPVRNLYGVVQYDFAAEREDELDAQKGEPLIIIAQSNHEWFVAKPIGRLGGPGLIPVSFVEIQDMATGKRVEPERVADMVRSGTVPKVEDWKKRTAQYKQNSIPLGRFDFVQQQQGQRETLPPVPAMGQHGGAGVGGMGHGPGPGAHPTAMGYGAPYGQQGKASGHGRRPSSHDESKNPSAYPPQHHNAHSQSTPALGTSDDVSTPTNVEIADADECRARYGFVTNATVESFHFEEDAFWFHVRATFEVEASLVLYRLYDDFYDFQISLMDAFPVEAGREPHPETGETARILPFMPGPTDSEDEVVCAQRVADLSVYLMAICKLPQYIRGHQLVFEFLRPKVGDVEVTKPRRERGSAERGHDNLSRSMEGMSLGTPTTDDRQLGQSHFSPPMNNVPMTASSSTTSSSSRNHPSLSSPSVGSNASGTQPSSAHTSTSSAERNSGKPAHPPHPRPYSGGGYHQHQHQQNGYANPTPHMPTSAPSSNAFGAASGLGPPTSTGVGQTSSAGFVKIKIFHRNTDDLIAIRVPPNVGYAALLEKVSGRLGGNVTNLRYREEVGAKPPPPGAQVVMAGGARLVTLANDEELDAWMAGSARLVLYAD